MRAILSLTFIIAAAVEVPAPALEEILVSGEQPGPALWSATRDGKTLWILGMHAPLPANATWRSRTVEDRIAESQVVVRAVQLETDFKTGFFAKLAAVPAVISVGKNPKGVTLKERVSPEAYAQWQGLKAKYIGDDDSVERLRPAFAADALRVRAMKAWGLSSAKPGDGIWPSVQLIAKKHDVEIREPEVRMSIEIDKPRAVIAKFREASLGDAECFEKSLARLEVDLAAMKMQANAWSKGNVDVLRKIPPPDPESNCMERLRNLILSGPLMQELSSAGNPELAERARVRLEQGLKDVNEVWLRTVEDALREHSSVFAVIPIAALFDVQGPLQSLRDRGYAVVEPE